MKVNFELYKVFYMVAKEMSFSKAGKKLFISQSAVSQNIRLLEEKLGVSLFNRSTKQVGLTGDGQALLQHIEPAVHMILSGESYLQETRTLDRGQLHIAASDTICRYYLLPYFKQFHNAYPGIELKVTNRTSVQCVALLDRGSVDLIVTNMPNKHIKDDMTAIPTKSFRDVFVANPKRIEGSRLKYEQLTEHPLLMLTNKTATTEFLMGLLSERNIDVSPSIELGSIDLLVDMARIDLGISFVPDFCVPPSRDLQILDLDENIPKRSIGLVTHNQRPLSAAASKFAEMLLE